ncbi:MAG: glycosyltransferase family 4 protein [Burkholderiales bacterium]
MRILFAHQNFPGQYAHLLRHFAAQPGNEIVFLTRNAHAPFPGIRKVVYQTGRVAGSHTHHYVRPLEDAVQHGQAVSRAALELREQGFVPDIMIGHNAWGETLYLKDVFPSTPLLAYFEYFYRPAGTDLDFDAEFAPSFDKRLRIRTLNAVNLLGLDAADLGQTATQWQQRQYPRRYRDMISVVHEGIDTETVRPDAQAVLTLKQGLSLSRDDEVLTYVARNLEPYRGFHVFMRALPEILRRRPKAQVLIVGGDNPGYGPRPPKDRSWRQFMLDEMGGRIDASRVHFLGQVPYDTYLKVLQLSLAHVYLTYPFVLSWSMLEAMAAGCLVIASATPPVEEVIGDGDNGLLVDFFDVKGLAEKVETALGERERFDRMRARARQTIEEHYDFRRVCLPRQLGLIQSLLSGASIAPSGARRAKRRKSSRATGSPGSDRQAAA